MTKIFISLLLIFEFAVILSQARNTPKTPSKKKINDFIKDIYNMKSVDDLTRHGVKTQQHPEALIVADSSGKKGPSAIIARPSPIHGRAGPASFSVASDVKDATPGKCDPKPECISNPLTLDINSNQLAFPPCINIHRCDGCCPANEKCVAIKSDEIKMQKVGIITFDGDNQPNYEDKMVTVTNHTECQCQCLWENDNDCKKVNKNFVKSYYECACECPEELSCDAIHEFDKETCSCKCRKDKFLRLEQTCRLKGFNWSDEDCRCEVSRLSINHKEIQLQKSAN